jgi:predicted nuclease of predicted toxin-antitoxin system
VKLLFDENLSPQLVHRVADLFPDSRHVGSAGLEQTPDKTVWEYAKANTFSIVTADSDFHELAITLGPPQRSSGFAAAITRHRWPKS